MLTFLSIAIGIGLNFAPKPTRGAIFILTELLSGGIL